MTQANAMQGAQSHNELLQALAGGQPAAPQGAPYGAVNGPPPPPQGGQPMQGPPPDYASAQGQQAPAPQYAPQAPPAQWQPPQGPPPGYVPAPPPPAEAGKAKRGRPRGTPGAKANFVKAGTAFIMAIADLIVDDDTPPPQG